MFELKVLGETFKVYTEDQQQVLHTLNSPYVAIDTETELIESCKPIKSVIGQFCYFKDREVHLVPWQKLDNYMDTLLSINPDIEIVMHTAPFDLKVLDSNNNSRLHRSILQNKITDISLRFLLSNISNNQQTGVYNLAHMSKKLLGLVLNKDKDIRLTFKRDMQLSYDHLKYAALDAIVTAMIREIMPEAYGSEEIQVKGYIGLQDIMDTGVYKDKKAFMEVRQKYLDTYNNSLKQLSCFGIIAGKKGVKKQTQKYLKWLEDTYDITFSRTKKSHDLQINESVKTAFLEKYNKVPIILSATKTQTHANGFLKRYLDPEFIKEDGRVHAHVSPIKRTGRISTSGPNILNPPREGGIRELDVAPENKLILSIDYDCIELCSLGQICLKKFGKSSLADILNEGQDPHYNMGQILKSKCKSLKAHSDKEYRKMSKPVNFGIPGGLGKKTFIEQARESYGVIFTEEQFDEIHNIFYETYPEMELYMSPITDLDATDKTFELFCRKYKIYPVVYSPNKLEHILIAQHSFTPGKAWHEVSKLKRYIATTLSGRVRRGCSYTEACNTPFQGLVSDGFKIAAWKLKFEEIEVFNCIYDEFDMYIDKNIDTRMSIVTKIQNLMEDSMSIVIPDVKVSTEAALMYKWSKEADPVYENGILMPYDQPKKQTSMLK